MTKPTDKTLSEILIKQGLLSEDDMRQAMSDAQASHQSLSSFISKSGLASEKQIVGALAQAMNLESIDLHAATIDKAVVERVPVKFAWYYKFMPVQIDGKTLTLAVSMPLDLKVQDEIRVHLGFEPHIVLAPESQVTDALKKHYGLAADTIDRILTKGEIKKTTAASRQQLSVEDIEKQSEDTSVIKLVNQIILEAYKKRATDIHIEPYRDKVRFRYRIDGVLVDANLPPEIKHFLLPILSRIKIMSNLSIVEKRLPQDGSAVVKTKSETLDLRVSTIPTQNGESMVIRILPTTTMFFSLEKLGISDDHVRIFRELIKKPHGIVFVTGPTGSGKTTTLYACLSEINSTERKIITIEDPVEYEMEGVTQIQVNSKVNLDFARGLRSVLRHDPDIIMVGEVRDLETAEIAIRTALTGHLVFSTIHTNDAASGITRLIDMGLEPFLVSSSIEAFIAQRLVRTICPHCKEAVAQPLLEVKQEIQSALGIKDINQVTIFEGKGCDQCNRTGFLGRTAIHEILVVNDEIRAAILEKPRSDHVRHIAIQQGMKTLRQDGWQKVIDGVTTPMEVMNVTEKDEFFTSGYVPDDTPPEKKETIKEAVAAAAMQSSRVIPKEVISKENTYNSRIYPRIAARVKIRYKIFHPESDDETGVTVAGDDAEHSTETVDISAGGLLFVSNGKIDIGALVELKIQLKEKAEHITCLAKVCRLEEDDMTLTYRIGVYYLDISSAERVRIEEFVKDKQSQTTKENDTP